VLKEIWTGELVKSLREFLAGTWLDGIPDSSSIVDNDVIHLVEVGVDPDVLVNNTTYPIPLQALDDKDIELPPVGHIAMLYDRRVARLLIELLNPNQP
jgi:hypothetical protein